MSTINRSIPLALMLVLACSGDDNTVILDGTPRVESATTSIAAGPEPTIAAFDDAQASGIARRQVDEALDQFNQALLEADYEIAGDLLAFESLHFFDLVAALSELGTPEEFDRSPFIAAVFAGVLRGWDGHPESGVEAFRQLGGLGQISFPPASESIEWLEIEEGVLFGLVDGFAFVTMRLQDEVWKVDLTQQLIRAETQRRQMMQAQTGLGETALASEFIFEPFGFAEPTPPTSREGGAMGALPAPVWNEFLRAVGSMEWTEAYGLLGSVTLLEDTTGVVALERARRNALTAEAEDFAALPFADALLALTLRATYEPAVIETIDTAEIFGLAMERNVVRLSTTETDLAWRTTSGIRFLGFGTLDGAGVYRSGTEWFVDGSVIAGSVPSDFATMTVDNSDPIALLILALNQITGGGFDASILSPAG